MNFNEEKILNDQYKDSIININGKYYIDGEVFMDLLYNFSLSDAMIGVLASELGGKIELEREELVDFIAHKNVVTHYTKDKCLIEIK